jgi:hypothetical protein
VERSCTANLLLLLRRISKEQGFMFHAYKIDQEGAYLYYNGEKYGPIRVVSYKEEEIRNGIMRLIKGLTSP